MRVAPSALSLRAKARVASGGDIWAKKKLKELETGGFAEHVQGDQRQEEGKHSF